MLCQGRTPAPFFFNKLRFLELFKPEKDDCTNRKFKDAFATAT
jgi:hypothetical protein